MRIQFNLFSLLLASSGAYAEMNYNMPSGVTPISHDIYTLHMTIFWVCVVIGALVFGTMIYSIIYHRKSRGYTPHPFHEKTSVELAWTFVPLAILVLLAIPSTQVLMSMSNTEKEDVTIKITGYQWKWRYDYINEGIHFFSNSTTPVAELNGSAEKNPLYLRTVDHPLVVPIHKKIRFLVTSNDVIHSWWVPDLGVKRDALPGFINEAWARINRAGTYYGQCTELCGMNHAYMPIVIIAMAEQDYVKWLAQQKGGAVPAATAPASMPATPAATANTAPVTQTATSAVSAPVATPAPTAAPAQPATTPAASATPATKTFTMEEAMKKGEEIYSSICTTCHQPTGEGMPPTYPALNGSAIVKGPLDAHLNRVLNGKPGTAMQAFRDQLTDEEIAGVLTYERNSWNNKAGTVVQPADVAAARNKPVPAGEAP